MIKRLDKECVVCGKASSGKLCDVCEYKIRTASSILSQNSLKLKELLSKNKRCDSAGFEKFIIYAHNIIENGREILLYKRKDILKKIDDLDL